jgi:hypothetical protein
MKEGENLRSLGAGGGALVPRIPRNTHLAGLCSKEALVSKNSWIEVDGFGNMDLCRMVERPLGVGNEAGIVYPR